MEKQELHQAVTDFLDAYPGEGSLRALAASCGASVPTMYRWVQGKNLAAPTTAWAITKHIRLRLLRQSLQEACNTVPNYRVRLAQVIGVPFSTIERWLNEQDMPHPALVPGLIKIVRDLIKKEG